MEALFNNFGQTHLLVILGAYLAGSIPFGLLLTRAKGLGDLRQVGSGSVGATNVLRTGSKGLAFLTVLLDAGKGAAAVLVANQLWGVELTLWAGLFDVLGHDFTLWLNFKGGKGVATSFGVLLAIAWPVALTAGLIWLVVALVSRYSSLAALAAFAVAPAYAWWQSDTSHALLALILCLLGFARHHANIARLVQGRESRIGSKAT